MRYVPASERARVLCQGAFLYASLMDAPVPSRAYDAAYALWDRWCESWTGAMSQRARAYVERAFDESLSWDRLESCDP